MASVVDICNMALGYLGAEANISSISPADGSAEAGYCARYYPIARAEALEELNWTWAKTRAPLALAATNPSTVWTYAYALPSDCLSAYKVLQSAAFSEFVVWSGNSFMTTDEMQVWSERGSADYVIEAGLLLTHEPNAVLLYTRDVTDTTQFSAKFTVFVSYLLSAYLAGPIIKGEAGAKTAGALRAIAGRVLTEAVKQDANGGAAERTDFIPSHLRSR